LIYIVSSIYYFIYNTHVVCTRKVILLNYQNNCRKCRTLNLIGRISKFFAAFLKF